MKMQKDINGVPLIKIQNFKRNSWFKENKICIPDDYKLQLGLYLYLRNHNKGLFAIGFLQTTDYVKPQQYDVHQREIMLVNVDYDLPKFKQYVDYARQWYEKYVLTGLSPEMTSQDKEWLLMEMKNTN
jgi:hypothetical protein